MDYRNKMLNYAALCIAVLITGSSCELPMQYTQQQLALTDACPKGFSLNNSFCYKFFGKATKQTFYHAHKSCSSVDSLIVSIHSAQEQDFVVQLAGNNTSFWIGLNDYQEQPTQKTSRPMFAWTSGEVLNSSASYHKWKAGEPVDHKHTDCVKSDSIGWSVAQGGCGASKLSYICKRRACSSPDCSSALWSTTLTTPMILPTLLLLLFLPLPLLVCLYWTCQGRTTSVLQRLEEDRIDSGKNYKFRRRVWGIQHVPS